MKMPDALLFEVETTVHVDANDGGKTTLDIKLSEGRNIVFCKNCRHCRKVVSFPAICPKDAMGIARIICNKWNDETRPDGFCHHGEEESK